VSAGDAVFRRIQSVARSAAAKSGTGAPTQEYLIRHTLGLRVRVAVSIGPWKGTAAWDVSTGDPIVPPPRQVTIDRILGEPITLLGYAPETTIAEKGVTILERGITSTRWRDYVDIVALARHGIDPDQLLRSARAVARHRGVTLEPVAPHLAGYGAVAQAKWAAWRRKEHLESACEENLDDQITLVASYLDSVFARGPGIGRGDISPTAD
jgi:Nucleotidyl transferase AbiEii toxin, Type IV TA system